MFSKDVYIERRNRLKKLAGKGVILLLGNTEAPMNYPANTYRFRQDSTFLYLFGLDEPGLAAIIDIDNNLDTIFGSDIDIDDIIWMGPHESVKLKAAKAGITHTEAYHKLFDFIDQARSVKAVVHYLPPYRAENKLLLERALGIPVAHLKEEASTSLIKGVIALRSVKEDIEITEIEGFMDVAYEMHTTAMKMAKEGTREQKIAGCIEGIAMSYGGYVSFPVILSKHGETLHNHSHDNILKNGDLLLIDAGAESPSHYATDHTRTIPVGGVFSQKQKEIYEIVLKANLRAIELIKPGITYKSIHLECSLVIAEGLKALGLMKGDMKQAVDLGAHALFFPHGLGHMMGLDVHDMEDLGENFVGYDEQIKRSELFGTAYLRLGRALQEGFVITVEPGIYFVPALIDLWKEENRFSEFINYDRVEEYRSFGGIRIEDDMLVTTTANRVLGRPIPKTVNEIEAFMKE